MTPTRTPFAGFLDLAPGDSLSSDGYAFQSQNPQIADLLAKIGAVLHQHDAHAAMVNPTTDPTLATAATGGSVPAATAISVAYTLVDGQGGESLPSPVEVVTTDGGYADPSSAPTGAIDYSAGTLLANTFSYGISVTDGLGGETMISPLLALTVNPGSATAEAVLSGFTAIVDACSGSSVTAGWRLWRTVGGSPYYLIGTGAYSTDGFTDDGVAGDCTQSPPPVGTTGGSNTFTATVPSAGQPSEATYFNLYACDDGSFTSPCLLGNYPVADFDAAQAFTSLAVNFGEPPATSQCYGGANQINPATDMLAGWFSRDTETTAITTAGTAEAPETLNMLGPSMDIYSVTVDEACRMRLYPTAAFAAADIGRTASSDPDVWAQNGCYYEHTFSGAATDILTPAILAVMQEGTIASTIAANISTPGGAITVHITINGFGRE